MTRQKRRHEPEVHPDTMADPVVKSIRPGGKALEEVLFSLDHSSWGFSVTVKEI